MDYRMETEPFYPAWMKKGKKDNKKKCESGFGIQGEVSDA